MENITINCENITDGQTCIINSSSPFITPFFSSGEVLISLFLFILIILEIIKLVIKATGSVTVIKKLQGNNTQDGKEFYNL